MNNKTQEIIRNIVLEDTIRYLNNIKYLDDLQMSICRSVEIIDNLKDLTPIEKIMYAILDWAANDIDDLHGIDKNERFVDVYPQKTIGKYRADFVVSFHGFAPETKYIIECDGHDFHEKTKEQAKYDKQRERFFVSQGYKVLRYTGSEIYNDYKKIKEELFDLFHKDINDFSEKEGVL